MTAPQFSAAWGQPPAPAPAQAPGYPPQQQYAPPAPPQGYAQPAPYGYPPAAPQYAPPAYDPYAQAQPYQPSPPQPPAFQPAGGTLDEYMNQKPAGAQYWKFDNPGRVLIGMVERDLRDSDVAQVTFQGQPVRRKDGSISQEKTLTVPVVNQDGTKALIEFKSHQRTAFEEAVSAATGGASRLPSGGGMIRGEFTHTEPSRGGGSPKKIVKWDYVPAEQVQQGGAPAMPTQPPAQQVVPGTGVPPGYMAGPAQTPPHGHVNQDPAYAAWLAQQQQQAAPVQQYAAPPAPAGYPQSQPAPAPPNQPAPQQVPPPQQYAPPGMDPAAAAQFAGLMGGAAPQ